MNHTSRVCLIGITGSGKSTLGNILCGEEYFKPSEKSKSESVGVKPVEAVWFGGKESKERFFCVDTCGFGDSEGRDESQLESLVKELKKLKYVNAFLVVLNGTSSRLDQQTQTMFQKLKEAFKVEIFEHVMIVHTNWIHSKKEIARRAKSGITELSREDEINQYFKSKLGYDTQTNPIPCAFVDSLSFKYPEDCDTEELKELTKQFEKIKKHCSNKKKFATEELKEYVPIKEVPTYYAPVADRRSTPAVQRYTPIKHEEKSSCTLI